MCSLGMARAWLYASLQPGRVSAGQAPGFSRCSSAAIAAAPWRRGMLLLCRSISSTCAVSRHDSVFSTADRRLRREYTCCTDRATTTSCTYTQPPAQQVLSWQQQQQQHAVPALADSGHAGLSISRGGMENSVLDAALSNAPVKLQLRCQQSALAHAQGQPARLQRRAESRAASWRRASGPQLPPRPGPRTRAAAWQAATCSSMTQRCDMTGAGPPRNARLARGSMAKPRSAQL